MRLAPFVFAGLLVLTSTSLWAQGVLLPSDPSGTDKQPNLGLLPKSSPAPVKQDVKPQVKEAPASVTAPATEPLIKPPVASGSGNTPALTEKDIPALPDIKYRTIKTNITPGGKLAPNQMDEQQALINKVLARGGTIPDTRPKNELEAKIKKFMEEQDKKYQQPPLILDEIPTPVIDEALLPSQIGVTVDSAYFWGPQDISMVQRILGYTSQDTPKNCMLRLDATVVTDKDSVSYTATVFPGTNETIRYGGKLATVSLLPFAMCLTPKGELPQTGSIIKRTGDKLAVPLQGAITCPATQGAMTKLDVVYTGDGKVKCAYR